MQDVVLVVESDPGRRAALCQALQERGRPLVEAADVFQAIASLGRADFGGMLISEARPISLRGVCRLARKRHPGIRIFVLLPVGTPPERVKEAVGLTIDTCAPDTSVDELARTVDESLLCMELAEPETLSTAQVHIDVEAALAAEEGRTLAEPFASEETDRLLLEGSLDDASGAALLMGLVAQEATGALSVNKGKAAGTTYFLRGEPVWFTHAQGDEGLKRLFTERGLISPDLKLPEVPEGQLLATLFNSSAVDADRVQNVLLEQLRERVLALATQKTGVYQFTENFDFANEVPILKVNVLGLILESRRRQMTPDRVLVLGAEMAKQFMVPGPALKKASARLAQLTRGIDMDGFVTGERTVQDFYDASRLDQMMGALVMLVLVDTHLVTLAPRAPSTSRRRVKLVDVAPPARWDAPALPEETMEIQAREAHADDDADQVLQLYFRLKPLTIPAQVLGVPMFADPADVETAYWQRMRELESRRLPEGAAGAVIAFRIEELRRKLTNAYQAMMATTGPMALPPQPRGS